MALSVIVYPGDGVRTQFNIPFALGYIKESDVTARVDGEVDGAGNQIYRTLVFLSPEIVEVQGTVVPVGTNIIFERTVVQDELIVDYEDGDVINEDNMNTSQKQMIMLVHQVLDGRFAQFQSGFDMGGFRITGLGDPVDPGDAANKAYVDARISTGGQSAASAALSAAQALASQQASASSAAQSSASATASQTAQGISQQARNEAVAARDVAVSARDSALSSEASASASAGTSTVKAAEAATSAATADTRANASAASATQSQTSATNSAGSATSAATSASQALAQKNAAEAYKNYAYDWSSKAVDTVVNDETRTGFSSYHWSIKAAASAAAAATFDPALYVAKTGSTMTGDLIIKSTTAAYKHIVYEASNGNTLWKLTGGTSADPAFRFLDSGGSTVAALNNGGQMWTSNYGWFHDRFALKNGDNYHAGSVFEVGNVAPGGNGAVDCPNPYVLIGLRTNAGNNNIFLRVNFLRTP